MFPYYGSSGHFNNSSTVVVRAVLWMRVFRSLLLPHQGTCIQYLWGIFHWCTWWGERHPSSWGRIPPGLLLQPLNTFLSFTSMVCSFASMIAISLSPSFLHFPHCVAKSLQKKLFRSCFYVLLLAVSLELLILCLQSCWFFIAYVVCNHHSKLVRRVCPEDVWAVYPQLPKVLVSMLWIFGHRAPDDNTSVSGLICGSVGVVCVVRIFKL